MNKQWLLVKCNELTRHTTWHSMLRCFYSFVFLRLFSLDKDSWNEGVGAGSDMQQRGQAGMEPSAAVKDSALVHGERTLPGELPVNYR